MFQVIIFDDATYGIRDQMSGQILAEYGEVLSFSTRGRAEKKARRIAKRFNRELRKAKKKGKI